MKKIVLIAAMVIASLAANANIQKSTSLVSFQNRPFLTELDTASIEKTKANEDLILSKVAFYNVERIVITNNKNQYIRIENNNGTTIIESNDSIDITVPAGNYYVYTTAKHTTAFYK